MRYYLAAFELHFADWGIRFLFLFCNCVLLYNTETWLCDIDAHSVLLHGCPAYYSFHNAVVVNVWNMCCNTVLSSKLIDKLWRLICQNAYGHVITVQLSTSSQMMMVKPYMSNLKQHSSVFLWWIGWDSKQKTNVKNKCVHVWWLNFDVHPWGLRYHDIPNLGSSKLAHIALHCPNKAAWLFFHKVIDGRSCHLCQ